ncbi:MAG: c-type cytochrome [Ferrovum sp.]|nr:c-type cytochrome [Ferrovum sp.]
MKSLKIALIVAGLLTAGTTVMADDAGLALAKKSGCLACHAVDKKVLGPSYKDVAAKYKGQADAETKLVAKVKNGGGGVWGPMPMPANTKVSDADLHTLVQWVLSR